MNTIIITGGAGFIGSHVIRRFTMKYPYYKIINVDSLTYAGNLNNLKDIEHFPNYIFEMADISKENEIRKVFEKYQPNAIIHLASESHVDRSIINPDIFINTNIIGTINLLNLCKEFWISNSEYRDKYLSKVDIINLFYHISTDEVYGSIKKGRSTEESAYNPTSPYSASKASSDHFVRAYGNTYGIPFIISNCSNNYGPNQFPEKLIPLCILNILNKTSIPVYGDGKYIRDWLFVIDHVIAIDKIFHKSNIKKTYNIGACNELTNIDLINEIIIQMDKKLGNPKGTSSSLITYIKDRKGHDRRYSVNTNKLYNDLKWKPKVSLKQGISYTIDWYLSNKEWLSDSISKS